MRKKLCPQCLIPNLYVKNSNGDRLPVYVTDDMVVIPTKAENTTEGFDLETIYCLGCSWSGSVRQLKSY